MRHTHIVWEGALTEMHSLAKVNRNIKQLISEDDRFTFTSWPSSQLETDKTPSIDGDIWISHQWPPRLKRPDACKYWIGMIPWEFGSIPVSWYIPMKYEMDEIWVYSDYNRECYIRCGLPAEKIRVIPLGVDTQVYRTDIRPSSVTGETLFRFLYVGGTIGRKGFDLLLKAYQQEFSSQDHVTLIVKDHGTQTHYKGINMAQLIKESQALPNCPPIEYWDHDMAEHELATLYRTSDCSVFPYRGEGFGLPIIESMACGTPVIVPNAGPAAQLCEPSSTYFISASTYHLEERKIGDLETMEPPYWIEPDVDALRSMMRKVYEKREALLEAGKKASAHIHAHYTWQHTKEAIVNAVEQVMSRSHYSRFKPKTMMTVESHHILSEVKEKRIERALGKSHALLHAFPEKREIKLQVAQLHLQNKKYLTAIQILDTMKDTIDEEREELQIHFWSTLAYCYGGIQSWGLAMDAFQQAAKLKSEVRQLEIPFLQSAIRSLRQFIGHLYKEMGDCYAELHHVCNADRMYQHALAHGIETEEVWKQVQQFREEKDSMLERILEIFTDYDQLLYQTQVSKSQVPMSKDTTFDKVQDGLQTYFLPGQQVHICDELRKLSSHTTTKWDGAILSCPTEAIEISQILDTYQWCNKQVKQWGSVMIQHDSDDNDTFQALHAFLVYGGWVEKAKLEAYSVYQRHCPTVLWQSPLHNASGYATEQQHFIESLKPYPFFISALAMDRPNRAQSTNPKRTFTDRMTTHTTPTDDPLIHYQAAPAHLFIPPKAPLSIGRTMFETDRLPPDWVLRLNELTEVWVPSQFNKETFIRSGVHEHIIRIVPGTLDDTVYSRDAVSPYPLKNAKTFKFLSVFDWSIRKGWDILLRAYLETFTALDDVTLVLKVTKINEPQAKVQESVEQLKRKLGLSTTPHILVLDARLTEEEMIGLYAACDAFVLPTRGEGWGRPFMEAMAMQLPVIGTKWSGQLEFMNDENSYLIEVERLKAVPHTMPPHFHGHYWAEPSLDHLKQLMKSIVQYPKQAQEKGKQARASLFPKYSLQQTGKRLYEQFRNVIQQY